MALSDVIPFGFLGTLAGSYVRAMSKKLLLPEQLIAEAAALEKQAEGLRQRAKVHTSITSEDGLLAQIAVLIDRRDDLVALMKGGETDIDRLLGCLETVDEAARNVVKSNSATAKRLRRHASTPAAYRVGTHGGWRRAAPKPIPSNPGEALEDVDALLPVWLEGRKPSWHEDLPAGWRQWTERAVSEGADRSSRTAFERSEMTAAPANRIPSPQHRRVWEFLCWFEAITAASMQAARDDATAPEGTASEETPNDTDDAFEPIPPVTPPSVPPVQEEAPAPSSDDDAEDATTRALRDVSSSANAPTAARVAALLGLNGCSPEITAQISVDDVAAGQDGFSVVTAGETNVNVPAELMSGLAADRSSGALFITDDGQPMTPRQISEMVASAISETSSQQSPDDGSQRSSRMFRRNT